MMAYGPFLMTFARFELCPRAVPCPIVGPFSYSLLGCDRCCIRCLDVLPCVDAAVVIVIAVDVAFTVYNGGFAVDVTAVVGLSRIVWSLWLLSYIVVVVAAIE